MSGMSPGSSSFHSTGKGGSYPIGIFRPCPPGSQGVVVHALGSGEFLGIALRILLKGSEKLNRALKARLQIARQRCNLLLDRHFGKLIHGHTQGFSRSLEHTVGLRIAETQDHLGGGFFAHDSAIITQPSPATARRSCTVKG